MGIEVCCAGCKNDFLPEETMKLNVSEDVYYFCSLDCIYKFSSHSVNSTLDETEDSKILIHSLGMMKERNCLSQKGLNQLEDLKKKLSEDTQYVKNRKCTSCGEPDEFSDETLCHACIGKWKSILEIKARAEGRMLGLKAGLEVAKEVCLREGYEFTFPDPESIKIEDDVENTKGVTE